MYAHEFGIARQGIFVGQVSRKSYVWGVGYRAAVVLVDYVLVQQVYGIFEELQAVRHFYHQLVCYVHGMRAASPKPEPIVGYDQIDFVNFDYRFYHAVFLAVVAQYVGQSPQYRGNLVAACGIPYCERWKFYVQESREFLFQ